MGCCRPKGERPRGGGKAFGNTQAGSSFKGICHLFLRVDSKALEEYTSEENHPGNGLPYPEGVDSTFSEPTVRALVFMTWPAG